MEYRKPSKKVIIDAVLQVLKDRGTIDTQTKMHKKVLAKLKEEPCPVCTSSLKKVHNATLYGGKVAIGFKCNLCGYLTGHRWREPSRYSFGLKGGI